MQLQAMDMSGKWKEQMNNLKLIRVEDETEICLVSEVAFS